MQPLIQEFFNDTGQEAAEDADTRGPERTDAAARAVFRQNNEEAIVESASPALEKALARVEGDVAHQVLLRLRIRSSSHG